MHGLPVMQVLGLGAMKDDLAGSWGRKSYAGPSIDPDRRSQGGLCII